MKDYAIGIDIGGTKILLGIVNKNNGEILCSVKKKVRNDKAITKIIKKITEGVEELFELSKLSEEDISLIGIGIAGQVDRKNGVLISAPNLEGKNFPIKELIEDRFHIPTFIGNDVEVATLGELKFGAGINTKNFVCIFVGTGVGSGIVINGEIYKGATGTAGEIGHIIINVEGRPCNCGGNGCLEAYASRGAIEKSINGALKKGHKSVISDFLEDDNRIRSSIIKKAVDLKDEITLQYLDEASKYLSSGIASIINFLNPEKIILGGGLTEAVDYFYEKTIKDAVKKALPVPAQKIIFEKAKLGDFSGVVGACFLNN